MRLCVCIGVCIGVCVFGKKKRTLEVMCQTGVHTGRIDPIKIHNLCSCACVSLCVCVCVRSVITNNFRSWDRAPRNIMSSWEQKSCNQFVFSHLWTFLESGDIWTDSYWRFRVSLKLHLWSNQSLSQSESSQKDITHYRSRKWIHLSEEMF